MAPNWSASHPDLKQGGFSIIWHEKAFVGGDRMTVRFTLMSAVLLHQFWWDWTNFSKFLLNVCLF